jgi:hypothetical protein
VLLLGDSTGGKTWTALENDVFGTQLLDEKDRPVLDEESTPASPIYVYDANSTDQLWTGFAGKGFGAIRAYADQDGNNIKSTYATKDALPSAMTGATAQSAGTSGLVPAPAAGNQGKFLKGDGTWDTPIFDKNYSFIWDGSPSEVYGMFQVSIGRDQYGYSGAPRKLTQVGRNGVLGYLLPEPVEGTIPVSVNDAGNNNCYALKTPAQLGLLSASNPTASDANKVLSVNTQGTPVWTALENDVFGTLLLDEHGQPVLDEESTQGNPIYVYDAGSTDQLWTGFAGKGFGANRAYADQDGNNIKATYATKDALADVAAGLDTALDTLNDTMESVAHAGMYDLGHKDESNLDTGNILAISCGNSNTELALTTVSTLTVLANPGVANFALLVDNTENSQDVTVTVKDSTGATTFYQSTAAGNTIGAGKICQVTCVGKCWTLAEFELPGA